MEIRSGRYKKGMPVEIAVTLRYLDVCRKLLNGRKQSNPFKKGDEVFANTVWRYYAESINLNEAQGLAYNPILFLPMEAGTLAIPLV